MHRMSAAVVIGSLALCFTAPVLADSKAAKSHAGEKGYVSAYDADEKTVLDVQSCDWKKNAHDYVECGKSLRERVKRELCTNKGKGSHTWFYQVSDGKKSKNTTSCK
jgi:hypothetical protein